MFCISSHCGSNVTVTVMTVTVVTVVHVTVDFLRETAGRFYIPPTALLTSSQNFREAGKVEHRFPNRDETHFNSSSDE